MGKFKQWLDKWFPKRYSSAPEPCPKDLKLPTPTSKLSSAVAKATAGSNPEYHFPIQIPTLYPGVVPQGTTALVAMDSAPYEFARSAYGNMSGFPGYQYLSMLQTRAEYRAFAESLSTELTREWITLNSSDTAGDATKAKITELTLAITDLHLQQVIQTAAQHDCYFGRGQMFIDIKDQDKSLPLVLSLKTIKKGSLIRISNVEPMWTSPSAYNALDPTAPDFYRPSQWWMMGTVVHASRLLTVITRPLADILKPAFNFSGMSLSQLAEPYVDNWLRTRQSVSDLLSNFSITALATSMEQVLSGGDDGTNLFKRAELFTLTRSNKGLMLLDKDREELVQVNTPLSGLHELQAQSQEQMCFVSHEPSIVLMGSSPGGLNASSDGEIKTFANWNAAQQEAHWRLPIETVIKVLQLSMYGVIDPNITVAFNPLFQMTAAELAAIRLSDSTAAGNYIDRGVIDAQEERERLARDPESGYQGLDITAIVEEPEDGTKEEAKGASAS